MKWKFELKSIDFVRFNRSVEILTADERLRLRERRERFLDLERLERDRERLGGDLVRVRRGGATTTFSLDVDNIPMTGSIAAEKKFCVSFTIDMASSISRWAASLLFASGLIIDCIEW